MTVISILLIGIGLFFLLVSAIGALRLPDFYTRSHAISVVDTLGTLLILSGLISYYGFSLSSAKLLFIVAFLYIANPTVTHIYVRAAIRAGLKPWTSSK